MKGLVHGQSTSLSFSHAAEFAAEKAHAPVDPLLGKSPGCPWTCQHAAAFRTLGHTTQGVQVLASPGDTWFF